jgi:hypothetical protein
MCRADSARCSSVIAGLPFAVLAIKTARRCPEWNCDGGLRLHAHPRAWLASNPRFCSLTRQTTFPRPGSRISIRFLTLLQKNKMKACLGLVPYLLPERSMRRSVVLYLALAGLCCSSSTSTGRGGQDGAVTESGGGAEGGGDMGRGSGGSSGTGVDQGGTGGSTDGGAGGNNHDSGGDGIVLISCPSSAPVTGSSCLGNIPDCFYEECSGTGGSNGRTSAQCRNGNWVTQVAPCGPVSCGLGRGTCPSGDICVISEAGTATVLCIPNPCGSGPISCSCLQSCGTKCTVMTTPMGTTEMCNNCPPGGCA